jgi:hypothetical protein
MKKLFVIWVIIFLLIPVFSFAQSDQNQCVQCSEPGGFVPCGRKCDDPTTIKNECLPCTVCDFFAMLDRLINSAIWISLYLIVILIIAFIVITAYARSRSAPESINKAKRALLGVIIGLAISYGAWVIVNTVLLALGVVGWEGFDKLWTVTCAEPKTEQVSLVKTFCGDGIIQRPNNDNFVEACDGQDLGGQTCQNRGFESGDLVCKPDCSGFDESKCVAYPTPAAPSLPEPPPLNPEPLVAAPTGDSSVVILVYNQDGAGFPYPSGNAACLKNGYDSCEIVLKVAQDKYTDLWMDANGNLIGGDPEYNNTPCDYVFGDGIHDTFRHGRPVLGVKCHVCPTL